MSEVTNYYERFKSEAKRTYPNFDKVKIEIPFRMLVIGSSAAGKTNICLWIIEQIQAFTRIYLYAKDTEETLYKGFIDVCRNAEKQLKNKYQFLTVSNRIEDLPSVDSFDPQYNNLLILDDWISSSPKTLEIINDVWIRGRKKSISSIFISQSYFKINKLIRQNSNLIVLKGLSGKKDLNLVLNEYSLGDKQQLYDMYKKATAKSFDFLLLDPFNPDKNLRYRKNLTGLKVEDDQGGLEPPCNPNLPLGRPKLIRQVGYTRGV